MQRSATLLLTGLLLASAAGAQTMQDGDLVLCFPNSPYSALQSIGVDGSVHYDVLGSSHSWISAARLSDGRVVVHKNSGGSFLLMYSETGVYQTQYPIAPANYASDIDAFSDNVIGVCSRGEGILLFDDQGGYLGALNPAGMLSPMGCKVVEDDTIWVADFATFPGNTDGKIWHLDRQGNVLHAFDTSFDAADVDIAPDGTVWVAGYDGLIAHYDVNGTLLGQFQPQIDSALKSLWSLAVGDDGLIWASGHYDSKVRGYDSGGNIVYVYDTQADGNSTFTFVLPGLSWAKPHCEGDGGGSLCPCGNQSAAHQGCANSSGAGASLKALGTNNAPNDDLRLYASGVPAGKFCLAIVGDQLAAGGFGAPMGDGLSCVGGSLVQLGVELASTGDASWGPGLRTLGGWGPADVRYFQVLYRDPLAGPCGTGMNLTQSLEVTFQP